LSVCFRKHLSGFTGNTSGTGARIVRPFPASIYILQSLARASHSRAASWHGACSSSTSVTEFDSAEAAVYMDWRNKRVHFRIRDVYIPEAEKLVMKLHGDDLLQGTVVDVAKGEGNDVSYAVINVPGLDEKLIVR
jgi:hypothetical protein